MAWEVGDQYIALVEQAAVVMLTCMYPNVLRQRDFIWFEDNSAVLASMTK